MTSPTSPTRTPAARRAAAGRPSRTSDEPHGLAAAPPRLKLALGLALVAAIVAAVALPLGVLEAAPPPGFASGPLLAALALLPVLLAVGLTAADHLVTGARVLIGAALLAPGALLFDLQFLLDSNRVARPELVMPTSLAGLAPALGGWLLIAGHVIAIAAGACAAGYAGSPPGSEYAESIDNPDRSRSLVAARRMLGLSLVCGVVIAIGVLMPALYSHDALLVAIDVVPNPWLVSAAGLFVAVVAPVALAWSAGTGNPAVHRGVALGVLTAVAAVCVPPIAAAALMDQVGAAPGPVLALVGAALAVVVSLVPARDDNLDDSRDDGRDDDPVDPSAYVHRPTTPNRADYPNLRDYFAARRAEGEARRLAAVRAAADQQAATAHEAEITLGGTRLHQAAGLLGVLLGVCAAISATTAVYTLTPQGGLAATTVVGEPTKLGLAAGVLVGVLGLLMVIGHRTALAVRPAFTVALGALALPAAAAVDDALGASRARDSLQATTLPGAGEQVALGAAFWLSVALLVGAAAAAVVGALAGVAEREELDLTDRPGNQILWAPVGLAALGAVGAFALPLIKAPQYPVPDLFSTFTVASTGQLLALLAVLAAVLQAPRARPARAAALLVGAAGVVGVRLLQFPLGSARIPGAGAALGWWLALLTLALLLVAAFVAGTAESDQRKR